MKVYTPEISWHERDPIYTCNFHPTIKNKLATSGVTGVIRLWEISEKPESKQITKPTENSYGIGNPSDCDVRFIANLKRHVKAVNVVRWNSAGDTLASAGDEACVFLWKENEIKNQSTLDMDEDDNKENWFSFKTLRGHLEDILDISWSADGSIIISGSIDNSVIIWDVATGNKLSILKEPKGFVQGVVCDPLGSIYACLATDRSLRIFSASNFKCLNNISKIQMSTNENNEVEKPDCVRIFHDDTMKSFYRRMCFTSDGNLLLAPSGCMEIENKSFDCSFIFTRNSYAKPALYIPHDKPSVAVSCCQLKFELNTKKSTSEDKLDNLFNIPYRYIFAIATEDSVYIYDTQNLLPFSYVSGIHYSTISDLSWSSDGRILCITSIDGFCSLVMFTETQLGKVYTEPIPLEEEPDTLEVNNIDPIVKEQKQNQLNFKAKKLPKEVDVANVSDDCFILFCEDSMDDELEAKVVSKEVVTTPVVKEVDVQVTTLNLKKTDGGKKRITLVPL